MITAYILHVGDIVSFTDDKSAVSGENTSSETAVKVITQSVVMTGNNRVFEAVGTGRARHSVEIYPSVAEEVTDVLFEAQDKVEKGDLLVQLDNREEKLAIELAEVRLKDSKSLLNRYEEAVKEGAVPESEVDSARADVKSARVALEQAKLALTHRKVIAPFTGIVGIPRVDPGDKIGTDTLITGLDDREVIYIDFEVPESLADALNKEQTITATTPAYPGIQFKGNITAMESRIDPESRTVMVRASVENNRDLLRPGMSFTTRWEIAGEKYPTVPEIALQWGKDGSYVWVVREGKTEKVSTQVIARTAGNVLLEGDITEGEQVVVEGLERVDQGSRVKILGNNHKQPEKQVEK